RFLVRVEVSEAGNTSDSHGSKGVMLTFLKVLENGSLPPMPMPMPGATTGNPPELPPGLPVLVSLDKLLPPPRAFSQAVPSAAVVQPATVSDPTSLLLDWPENSLSW